MRRFAPLLLCLAALAGGYVAATRVSAQLPATCQFPDAPDQFQTVAPGTHWTAAMHNQLLCAINELETYVLALHLGGEVSCVNVSLYPAERKLVTAYFSSAPDVTDGVMVSIREATNGWIEMSGIKELSGSAVTFYAFNHDAATARSGYACAHLIRS